MFLVYLVVVCFLQNNLFISKKGTQRTQKTNHYILLTNISIKRCIKTSFETDLLREGGRVPARQVPYRQGLILYLVVVYFYSKTYLALAMPAWSNGPRSCWVITDSDLIRWKECRRITTAHFSSRPGPIRWSPSRDSRPIRRRRTAAWTTSGGQSSGSINTFRGFHNLWVFKICRQIINYLLL